MYPVVVESISRGRPCARNPSIILSFLGFLFIFPFFFLICFSSFYNSRPLPVGCHLSLISLVSRECACSISISIAIVAFFIATFRSSHHFRSFVSFVRSNRWLPLRTTDCRDFWTDPRHFPPSSFASSFFSDFGCSRWNLSDGNRNSACRHKHHGCWSRKKKNERASEREREMGKYTTVSPLVDDNVRAPGWRASLSLSRLCLSSFFTPFSNYSESPLSLFSTLPCMLKSGSDPESRRMDSRVDDRVDNRTTAS